MRVRMKVKTAGYNANEIAILRVGYAKSLIRVGYAVQLDNLADAMSAEPTRFGLWEDDPRASEETG
jgi:hypothetical protein